MYLTVQTLPLAGPKHLNRKREKCKHNEMYCAMQDPPLAILTNHRFESVSYTFIYVTLFLPLSILCFLIGNKNMSSSTHHDFLLLIFEELCSLSLLQRYCEIRSNKKYIHDIHLVILSNIRTVGNRLLKKIG